MDSKLKKILSEAQFNRFQQIDLQVQGPRAFMSPRLIEGLEISKEQGENIREILEANRPQPGQQMGDPDAQRAKVVEKILASLNNNQRATYKRMVGAPFKLSRPQGPGGQRGPGGPGGQGGPGNPPPPFGN